MRERFLSVPVLIGGTIIAVIALTWGVEKMGIDSSTIFLFTIPFVFPAAVVHRRAVYLLIIFLFLLTAWSVEVYTGNPDFAFLISTFYIWTPLIVSAEIMYQISSQRRRADEISKRRALELEAMDLTMSELSSDLNLERFLVEVVERAAKLLNASTADLGLFDKDRNDLEIVATFPYNRDQVGLRMKLGEGSMGRVAVTKRANIINDYKSWVNAMSNDISMDITSCLDVPLLRGDELIGVLGVGRHNRYNRFSEDDQNLLSVFARQAIIAINNARLYQEIQTLAFTDALTGINNRRRLFELAEKEFLRAQRYDRPLSIILLDIDHFKPVNDQYGHAAGDIVLRWFAQECSRSIRDNIDIIGRFGGEEFAILLPETNIGIASVVAQRLHEKIARSIIQANEHELKLTCSMGVASVTNEIGLTLDHLVDRADKALYKAKETRNTISWWNDDVEAPQILKRNL